MGGSNRQRDRRAGGVAHTGLAWLPRISPGRCAQTVQESIVFSDFGLGLNGKQIPRFVENACS
jgi:hypothetical protein